MKKIKFAFITAFILTLVTVSWALAQSESLVFRVTRDWGYGGLNGDIEGLFSMHVTGPSDLVRVEYYVDENKIGEVDQPPFSLQFNTDDYPLGAHKLYALGYSKGGQEYRSTVITANFVPKQSSAKILLPVLGIVLAAIILSALLPWLTRRGKHLDFPLGAERKYGLGGGGICPNCQRPFALPLISPHFGITRLAVCPFCGKWSMVRTKSPNELHEAEQAELNWQKSEISSPTDEDNIRKNIDDSKYQDL
jgi:hypothetical protein